MDAREINDHVMAIMYREQQNQSANQSTGVNSTGFGTGVTALLWVLGVILSGGGVYMMQTVATESRLVKLEEQSSISEGLPDLIEKFGQLIEKDNADRKQCMEFLIKKNNELDLEITQIKYEVNMLVQSQNNVRYQSNSKP